MVVIPRVAKDNTKYDYYTIQNGWTNVLTIPGKTIIDIGGGKTNPSYEKKDTKEIIKAVMKESLEKVKKNPSNIVPVLTGKIRSDVEKMVNPDNTNCNVLSVSYKILLKNEKDKNYQKYFDNLSDGKIVSYKLSAESTLAASESTLAAIPEAAASLVKSAFSSTPEPAPAPEPAPEPEPEPTATTVGGKQKSKKIKKRRSLNKKSKKSKKSKRFRK